MSKRSRLPLSFGVIAFVAPLALVLTTLGFSCGGSTTRGEGTDGSLAADQASSRPRLDAPLRLGGPCDAVVDTPPLLPANHVGIGTEVDYDSNPPSSGPHYPIWAAYQSYVVPVDRRYYVHDLEHGAIVLVYNCAVGDAGAGVTDDAAVYDDAGGPGPCPEVAAQLQAIIDAFPNDPKCDPSAFQPRVRFVLTPDPLLDVPVAAAAWGWTYKASCVDTATLSQFAKDHYDQGTEEICANGQSEF
ncbi:MAG TPA: DUF3105 domain-containing protein [Polyangiaceae bacterium]